MNKRYFDKRENSPTLEELYNSGKVYNYSKEYLAAYKEMQVNGEFKLRDFGNLEAPCVIIIDGYVHEAPLMVLGSNGLEGATRLAIGYDIDNRHLEKLMNKIIQRIDNGEDLYLSFIYSLNKAVFSQYMKDKTFKPTKEIWLT
jgi:hypothetical protein